jgi:hypothetical protein
MPGMVPMVTAPPAGGPGIGGIVTRDPLNTGGAYDPSKAPAQPVGGYLDATQGQGTNFYGSGQVYQAAGNVPISNPNGGVNVSYGANAGANAAAAGFMNAGQQAQYGAPAIDQTNSGQDRGMAYGGLDAQKQALALMQQTAQGGGAAQQALAGQFDATRNASMQSQLALANSARGGGASLAAAQGNAQQTNAINMSQAAAQKGQASAQLSAAAQQGLSAAAQGYTQSSLGLQQADQGAAAAQAGLIAQQQAANQQTGLGYAGLANSAELGQLGATGNVYANNLNLTGQAQQIQAQQTNAAIGAGATGAAAGLGALAAL